MSAKTPLILLPGLLLDTALWTHQIKNLDDIADMTVAELTHDDSIEGMAERTLTRAPDTFALAGLSMGGYVAQEMVRKAPDRIERLALLDTSARPDSPEQKKIRKSLMKQVQVGRFRGVTTRLLPLLIHEDRFDDEDIVDTIMSSAENVGKEAYLHQQQAILSRPDTRKNLKNISCPTLVLCGRQDILTPVDLHEEMAGKIPNASLIVIEDCGHLSTLENPDAVNAAMRSWLTE
ncbi:MAG: alpha/beta hydrolase [Rhodospirillales bacterium]